MNNNGRLLNSYINIKQLPHPIDWQKVFDRQCALEVEIGCGMGEVLVRKAHQYPNKNFVGLDIHPTRILEALKRVDRQDCGNNVCIVKADAWWFLQYSLAKEAVDNMFCFFPCPWPKLKHEKHRLFSKDFLELVSTRLKKDGCLNIITDYYPYEKWIAEQASMPSIQNVFSYEVSEGYSNYDTKFEKKWKAKGQRKFLHIKFRKKYSYNLKEKELVALQTHDLKHFDPNEFKFDDVKEDAISIILKDKLFDPNKQHAIIYCIVQESNLLQHFRISIIRKSEDKWIVRKTDGQDILITPGINRALDLVYEAAGGNTDEK